MARKKVANTSPPYTIADLSERASIAERSIRRLVQRGVLPAVRYRGPEAKYGQEHLLRLLMLRKLQGEGMSASGAGEAVRAMSLATVEAALPGELHVARAQQATANNGRERWSRILLAPGLELSVREGDLDAERLALEILAKLGR